MTFSDFFKDHQKIIIVILLLIIAFVIYRYFWERKSIKKDFSVSNVENRLNNLESAVGIGPLFQPNSPSHSPLSPTINPNNSPNQNTTIIPGQTLHQICLNEETQKQIRDDINKKLQEINTCDCRETCAIYSNFDVNNTDATRLNAPSDANIWQNDRY